MPGQQYSMAGQGMRPGQPGQHFGQRPHAQGLQQQAGRPAAPGMSLPLPMVNTPPTVHTSFKVHSKDLQGAVPTSWSNWQRLL